MDLFFKDVHQNNSFENNLEASNVPFFLHLSRTSKRRNRHFPAQIIRYEWACQRLLQPLRIIWEWRKNKQHEKTARGCEEIASELYPLLSTASPLFLCFVFGVPLSFSSNHYVNAMRRIMRDNKVERIYDYTCNPYIVMAFQTIHFRWIVKQVKSEEQQKKKEK